MKDGGIPGRRSGLKKKAVPCPADSESPFQKKNTKDVLRLPYQSSGRIRGNSVHQPQYLIWV
jgi:hypothetical protein